MRLVRDSLLAGLVPWLLMLVVMPLVGGGRLFFALSLLGANTLGSLGAAFDRDPDGTGLPHRARRAVAAAGLAASLAWLPAAARLAHTESIDAETWFHLWPFLLVPMWLGVLLASQPRVSLVDLAAWSVYACCVGVLCWWSVPYTAAWHLVAVYLAPFPPGILVVRGVARAVRE